MSAIHFQPPAAGLTRQIFNAEDQAMASREHGNQPGWTYRLRVTIAAHPFWALAFLVLATLGAFLAKPFNMDEPLVIWTARHICDHPGDPYGFAVNWFGTATPMWD